MLEQQLKESPTFCVAPWTHTFISPQSERRMCCASREKAKWQRQYIDQIDGASDAEYNPNTLEEHWNSPYMNSIRLRMLSGEKLDECAVCNDNLLNLHSYRKYFNNTLFPNKIIEIISSTASDGSTLMKPISFDYRISNLCNFKCRMCVEQLSSSWESEKRQLGTLNTDSEIWLRPGNKQRIEKFQSDVVEQELWDAVRNGSLEEIYWVGGEPLMYQIHWDIMEHLVNTGQSKNVVVRYNTNLSKVVRNNVKLYDLLIHFKRVNICASMDATGVVAEYIRTGLKWDVWLTNFKNGMFLIDLFGPDALVIDVTITLPGLMDMKNLMDLAASLKVKSYVKICFDFESTALMSPMCVPREILNPILDELIAYEKTLNSKFTKIYAEMFIDMKTRQNFADKYPTTLSGISDGKKVMSI
jgi:organic radical activating enzyme